MIPARFSVSATTVPAAKLPASCPPAGQKGWDKHPRVYLQLSRQKPRQHCPYCGALYVLETEK
ncbi:MAG: zinc-finger domain-containing protein [Gammaproteobacteria bacterium]